VRKMADCRTWPSETGCTLTFEGAEEGVVTAAAMHAVASHAHEDTDELREQIREGLVDDRGPGRYGTVMIATLTGDLNALQVATEEWAAEPRAPGFFVEEVLVSDDGRTIVLAVFFEDQDACRRLAQDPTQDQWYSERVAPHVKDVRWIDGTTQRAVRRWVRTEAGCTSRAMGDGRPLGLDGDAERLRPVPE
jgi:hypothetical protein